MNEAEQNDHFEFSARLSAHSLLLETLYANIFLGKPDHFRTLMDELLRATREAPAITEPSQAEFVIELQARCAVHLQRFGAAVLRRVEPAGG